MEPVSETPDLLNLQLRLAATPDITFVKPTATNLSVAETNRSGFTLHLEAVLPYEALNRTITAYVRGMRLDVSEGFIRQYIIIESCQLYSNGKNLVIEASFSGSYNGTVYFTGKPVYDPHTQTIALQHMTYDLKTKSFLLKGLKWLFYKLILDEIKKYTVIDIASYQQKATEALTKFLNGEWAKGIRAAGRINELDVTGIEAQQQQLGIAMQCSGDLHLTVSGLQLKR